VRTHEIAKTPRERFDTDDKLPKIKEHTLQPSPLGRESRNFQPAEPGTQLLPQAEIWRDLK